jgi:translocator protein
MSPSRQWLGLAVFIGICFAAAGVGAMLTASSVNGWYVTLHKPSWNPPNEVFGPVWTILYLCMAIAAWLVWRRQGLAGAAIPLMIFAVQLTLNVADHCGLWRMFARHAASSSFGARRRRHCHLCWW